jgi:hypothetical protein
MFHAACGLSKCSTYMLHRSIKTTTMAIPTRRAAPRRSPEVRRKPRQKENCALHHFFFASPAASDYVPIIQCSNHAG